MATQINQIDDERNGITILRVDGELLGEDARLLERIASQIADSTGNHVIIDLADLRFMDSDAAPIVRQMEKNESFSVQGLDIFLQTVVNEVERHGV